MSVIVRTLDIVDALGIVPYLCNAHRAELLRTHPDLTAWARGRVELPGPQWAMEAERRVMAIGGVIDRGEKGTVWFAGAMGWERHTRPLLRVFREIRKHGRFRALQCRCYADNTMAQALVERLGFKRGEPVGSLVPYEMVLA